MTNGQIHMNDVNNLNYLGPKNLSKKLESIIKNNNTFNNLRILDFDAVYDY